MTLPSWHAEPVDAAISGTAFSSSAPIQPTKFAFSVFGRRSSGCPFRTTRSPSPERRLLPESIAEPAKPIGSRGQGLLGDHARSPQTDDIGHVLGASATASFVPGAVDERLQLHAPANVDAPTPFGAYTLWPARERRSTPSALTSTAIFPTDWAASVWTSARVRGRDSRFREWVAACRLRCWHA